MRQKQLGSAITGRTGRVATEVGRRKVFLATVTIAGVLSLTAYVFCARSFPAPPQLAPSVQKGESLLAQIDDEERLVSGSLLGCNSPAPLRAGISMGRSSEETNAGDLGTPAGTVSRVLSLLDQGATGDLTPCLYEETGEPISRLYPHYLGPPVELREVNENGAKVVWEATVHTEFSLRGQRWSPGATITLTARLVQVEGRWKLLQLHEGDREDGPP